MRIKKLACIAYDHRLGLEDVISRYPLAIINYRLEEAYGLWLHRIKQQNPDIRLINYVQVASQDFNPTMTGEVMSNAYGGYSAWHHTSFYPGTTRKMANYLSLDWQDLFFKACDMSMEVGMDGLFLDNCSVWYGHVRSPGIGPRMADALQDVIRRLRERYPRAILIGNSAREWTYLNGEMGENRPGREYELWSNPCHTHPEINLSVRYTDQEVLAEEGLKAARNVGAWFCAQPDGKNVKWFDCFNNVPLTEVEW